MSVVNRLGNLFDSVRESTILKNLARTPEGERRQRLMEARKMLLDIRSQYQTMVKNYWRGEDVEESQEYREEVEKLSKMIDEYNELCGTISITNPRT